MKKLKRCGIVVLILPIMLLVIWGLYEALGMGINHLATAEQTKTLQMHLENEIADITIIGIHSETGNTSGTGNHVDCLSTVTFTTAMSQTAIVERLSLYYAFDGGSCFVEQTTDGYYTITLNTQAPFADNIEGH